MSYPKDQILEFYYFPERSDGLTDPERISVEFSLKPIVEEGGQIDQYINRMIFLLLDAAKIEIPDDARELLNEYWSEVTKVEKRQQRMMQKRGRKETLNERIERLYLEHMRKNPNGFLDNLKAERVLLPLMLHNKLIKFHPNLSTLEQTQGLRLLKFAIEEHYKVLLCDRWAGLRLLIGEEFLPTAEYLQIPFDFRPEALVQHVREYFDKRDAIAARLRETRR